ncbi:MAG: hypothetical protein COA38_18465 [Fluviicola sp.]|nr:MAG: hypothetical protein COA38_18465 [Fluviicola sp.]
MSGLKLFYFVLFGQTISLLGTTLTNFGLGVWAYELSNEVTDFTSIAIASTLPGLVFGPFIGALIDRAKRKTILLCAQLGCALVTVVLAALYMTDQLTVWMIVIIVPVASVCTTMLQVGFTSSISLVVPKESLSKANGMLMLGFGTVQLAGPMLAGLTLDTIGMRGIFIIDIATFIVGLVTIAIVSLPTPKRDPDKEKFTLSHAFTDLVDAYRYMKKRKGLLSGLYVFTLVGFNVSVVQVLFLPLVLGLGTRTDLGFVQSVAGMGAVVGGILMVVWKGASRQMYAVLGASLVVSVLLIIVPIGQEIWLLAVGGFFIMMVSPIAATSSQTLWQKKIAPSYQGRVFSLRNTINRSAQPLAFLSAGFFADTYFEPHMVEGGVLAEYFGGIWGVGHSRGIALMISFAGAISFVIVALTWFAPGIRRCDIDIPDAIDDVVDTGTDDVGANKGSEVGTLQD